MGKILRILLILAILSSIAVGGILILASRADIGVSAVEAGLGKAAREYLQAEATGSSISGNPLKGFTISDLSLTRNGDPLFSSQQVTVSFRLLSLVKGTPQVKTLSFGGAVLDWTRVAPLIRNRSTGEFGSIPFDRFEVHKTIVRTPAGDFRIEDGQIQINGQTLDASGSLLFRDTPFTANGSVELGQDRVDLRRMEIMIAGGKISLSGRLTPAAAISGKISDLDLEMLGVFWPDLEKQGYSGSFSTTLEARGILPDVDISGVLEIPKGTVYGITVQELSSPWTFSRNALEITDIQGSANGTSVSGKIQFVFSSLPPVTTIDFIAREADTKAWQKSFPWLSIAAGTIDSAEIRLQGPSNSLSGPITLRSSKLTIAKQPLSDILSTVTLKNGSRLDMDIGAEWLGARVSGKGGIDIAPRPQFDLTFSGKDLDLSRAAEIIPVKNLDLSGKASGSVRVFGKGQEVQSEGTLWSGMIRAAGEDIEKPDFSFSYQKGTISLRSISARWRGAKISGSGTVSGLAQEKGVFDLSGKVNETDISSLAGFAPALKDLGLKGTASANWFLKGPVKAPLLALEISSDRVSAQKLVILKALKILTKIALPHSDGVPDMRLDMAAEEMQLHDLSILNPRTALNFSAGKLAIENGQGEILGAKLAISGSASLPSKNRQADLDLKGTISGMELSRIGKTLPVSMQGPFDAAISIKGTLPDPQISLSGRSPSLTFAGLNLSDLVLEAKGTPSIISIEEFRASAGGGSLGAKGDIRLVSGGFDMDFAIDGSGMELAHLTKELQGNGAVKLSGGFDASVTGSFKEGRLSGKGELFSDKFKAYGLVFTGASVPLLLQEDQMIVQNATGAFYGGSVSADGSIGLSTQKWDIRASVSGADMDPVIRDAFPPLEGRISGKGDLDIALSGAFGRHLLVTGRGNLIASNGEIAGFKALRALSTAYGLSSIRYRLIDASFKVDGNVITLLPGSRATAEPEDPLYRYFSADGPAGPGGNLNLFCSGLVNVQALNTLLGAIQGLAGMGSASPQALLEGLIGGFVGGMGGQDFRDVRFRLRGTLRHPSLSDFKVASSQTLYPNQQAGAATGQTQYGDSQKMTIYIPTGEGADTPDNTGKQVQKQLIEQILKNIIPGIE